jgi:predicted ester cyclase
MSHEQNEAVVRRIYEEVLNAGDLDLVRDVIAAQAVDHAPRSRSSLPIDRPEAIEEFLVEFCIAFPDAYWTVEQVYSERDTIVVATTVSGNHHAEFRGLRPMGGHFTITAVDRLRLSGGKIVEHWGELDLTNLQQQLTAPFQAVGQSDALEGETESPR